MIRSLDFPLSVVPHAVVCDHKLTDFTTFFTYFLDVVKELYHRKDLGSKVETANQAYISLFEKMLAEVLLLQRSKFNVRYEVYMKIICSPQKTL
jgi:hypothetical protein